MYFAIKYARKKHKERQAAKLAGTSAQDPAEAQVLAQPSVEQPGVEQLSAQPKAVEDEKAEVPVDRTNVEAGPVQQDVAVPAAAVKSGDADPVVSDEEKLQKKKRRAYRTKIIFGLVAPFALQALDTTIIASALPYIAKDFSTTISLTDHS